MHWKIVFNCSNATKETKLHLYQLNSEKQSKFYKANKIDCLYLFNITSNIEREKKLTICFSASSIRKRARKVVNQKRKVEM